MRMRAAAAGATRPVFGRVLALRGRAGGSSAMTEAPLVQVPLVQVPLVQVPLVQVNNISRVFDLSRPWLERLTQRLPRQFLVAAANISFSIDRRETFGLVGESGSGKSTIARMIVGLIAPSGGDVVIDGISMTDRAHLVRRQKVRQRIQMVFQDPYSSLNPRWRAFDIIAEPIRAFRLCDSTTAISARVGELLR